MAIITLLANNPADVISPVNQMAIKFTSNGENITEYDASKATPVTRWQSEI
jgi:hypothetical protein